MNNPISNPEIDIMMPHHLMRNIKQDIIEVASMKKAVNRKNLSLEVGKIFMWNNGSYKVTAYYPV